MNLCRTKRLLHACHGAAADHIDVLHCASVRLVLEPTFLGLMRWAAPLFHRIKRMRNERGAHDGEPAKLIPTPRPRAAKGLRAGRNFRPPWRSPRIEPAPWRRSPSAGPRRQSGRPFRSAARHELLAGSNFPGAAASDKPAASRWQFHFPPRPWAQM